MLTVIFKGGIQVKSLYEQEEIFWEGRFDADMSVTTLPYSSNEPSHQKPSNSRTFHYRISEPVSQRMISLVKGSNMALFTILLTGVECLLYKYTRESNIIVGIPRRAGQTDGRRSDTDILFLNDQVSGESHYKALFLQCKQSISDAIKHQHIPFRKMAGHLNLQYDSSGMPIVNTVVAFRPLHSKNVQEQVGFDVLFEFDVEHDRIQLDLSYNANHYHHDFVVQLAEHLNTLYSALLHQPELEIAKIEMLSASEKKKLLVDFNDTDADYPRAATLHQLFEAQAERTPDHIAVVYETERLTYSALNQRANQLARTLRDRGVQAEQLVGILCDRSVDMIVAILAVLKAGGAYVPIDPTYPQERIHYMLEDSGISMLLLQSHLQGLVEFSGTYVNLGDETSYNQNEHNLTTVNNSGDLAYVIYTSGTTGKPKGTLIEHKNVVRLLFNSNNRFDFNASDVWTLFHSYCFDFSVWEMYGALLYGGKLVIVPQMTARSPQQFLQLLSDEHVTILNQTPTYFYQLIQEALAQEADSLAIRKVIFGGEALNPSALQAWRARYPQTQLINMYGITETTVHVTYKEITDEDIEAGRSNIGQAIPTLRIYIMNDDLQLQPVGSPGEMYVAGEGVARGYLNRPDLTSDRFIENPFVPGERMYRSSDLARWLPDGKIEYLVRLDHQVKIRGFRIELSEIEAQLLKHPDISEAVVLVREDASGQSSLCAYVVMDASISVAALRSDLSRQLPQYMVPAYFKRLEALPLTPNGKLDRKTLIQMALEIDSTAVYEPPGNDQEAKLVDLWKQVLEYDRIGVNDNFFELGGDSIKAIRLIGFMNDELNWNLKIHQLYEFATIKALSNYMVAQEVPELVATLEHKIRGELDEWRDQALAAFGLKSDANIEDIYPTSDIVKGMISISLVNEEDAVYHDQCIYEITDPAYDFNRMQEALSYMVDKHEILRSQFYMEREAYQIVYKQVPVSIEEEDLRGMPKIEQEQTIQAAIDADRARPFALDKETGWRMKIFRVDDQHMVLCWICHHAIMDGWSVASFMTELMQVYAGGKDQPIQLPAKRLDSSYKDYIVDQRCVQREPEVAQFWSNELEDYKRFPLDYYVTKDPHFHTLDRTLDAKLLSELKEMARSNQMHIKTICFAAYLMTLRMFTNEDEFVIGLVENGRPMRADGDKILGCFLNTIPFKTRMPVGITMDQLLEETHQKMLKMKHYGRLSLPHIVEAVGEPQYGQNPFFDILFNFVDFHVYEQAEPLFGTESKLTLQSYEKTNTLLNMTVSTTLDQLFIKVVSFLPEELTVKMTDYFERVLQRFVEESHKSLLKVDVMPPEEKQTLLGNADITNVTYPKGKTIQSLFEEQVEQTPDHIAVFCEGEQLSYRKLNVRANQLARTLRTQGLRPGQLTGIMCDRSLDMLVGILAILKAGGAYVPIDPEYPEERIAFMLEDSGVQLLLVQSHVQERVSFSGAQIVLDDGAVYSEDGSNLVSVNNSHDLAYVIYTSGTTGKPKGTLIEHNNVVRLLFNSNNRFDFNASDVWTLFHSYCFDFSVWEMYGALLYGGKVVIVPQMTAKSPQQFLQLLSEQQVTILNQTPTYFYQLLHEEVSRDTKDLKVRKVIFGGEALNPQLLKAWKMKYPQTQLINMYGITETTVHVTYKELTDTDIELGKSNIGQAIPTLSVYILDTQQQLQPIGVPGEMYVAGEGVARGYLNRSELTAEKFIENPFVAGERMYRTGDLARWLPDGNIEYLGRIDDQVKIRGYRIELAEVEAQLLNYPEVLEAVVLVRKDHQDQAFLCAYVVMEGTLTPSNLKKDLSKHIPHYMVPAYFIQLDTLPLTSNGKLNRSELLGMPLQMESHSIFEAPSNHEEEVLAQIWREVLQRDRISIHDPFFDLGGDSIKAIQLISSINKALNWTLKIQHLYQYSNIRTLVNWVKEQGQQVNDIDSQESIRAELEAWKTTVLSKYHLDGDSNIEDLYPMSDIAQGMISLSLANEEEAIYHDQCFYQFEDPAFSSQDLHRALEFMVAKHDILRSQFHLETEAFQIVYKDIDVLIEEVDLREFSKTMQNQIIQDDIVNDRKRPFRLDKEFGWRMKLFRVADQQVVLGWICHHAILDGWSVASFMTEFIEVYNGMRAGVQQLPAPRLQSSYKDYVVDQWSVQREAEVTAFWQQELQDYKRFPIDLYVPKTKEFSIFNRTLDPELAAAVKDMAHRHHIPLRTVCLAAFMITLNMFAHEEEFVVGLVENGRPMREDGDKILGCFLNTIPFKVTIASGVTWKGLLHDIHHKLAEMKHYGRLSLPKIIEAVGESHHGANPFFDVILNYVDFHVYEQVDSQYFDESSQLVDTYGKTNTLLDMTLSNTLGQLHLQMLSQLPQAMLNRIADYCETILYGMTQDIEEELDKTALLSSEEKTKLLVDFNATAAEYPRDKTIHQLFEERVERTPEQVAVVFGSEQLTYQGLNARANQLARSLRAKGVKANQLVGILCDRSLDMVVAMLGILKAGGAYVPIDPEYPADRIQYMLEDSRAEVLLIQRHLQANVSFAGMQVVLDSAEWAPEETSNLESVNTSNDLAYVMYTSGTTGKPKGNLTTHYNIVRLVLGTNYIDLTEQDNVLQASNYAFDGSTFDIYGALLNGARLTLISKESLLDMQQLTELIEQQSISVMFITTALFNLIVDVNIGCLARVRHVLFGGERVSVEHVRKGLAYLGEGKLKHVYGPTECTVFTTCYDIDQVEAEASTVPIGSPISNATVYIVNPEYQLQPIGVAGELCVGGDGLVQGYLNRPDLTAEKFVANPFVPGERMYRTGDLARWLPDGTIEYLGRIDDQVKIRGFRIELGEVESALLQLEAIQEAIVVARGDDSGQKALCAYFVADADLAVSGVKQDLARALPSYMIPSYFVQLDAMPLTPNGKVDRRALPEPEGRQAGTDYVAPRTPLEAELAAIWQDVLGVEQAGVQDNFFELGGHSLRATTLVSRIHKALDIVLPLAEVFQAPTIEAMAKIIEGMDQAAYASIPQAKPSNVYPVSSAQKRLYILQQMEGASISYNMPGVFELEGIIDRARLEDAFNRLVARHETLRTGFELAEGEPVQRIHEHIELAVEYIEASEVETRERIDEFVRTFALDQPPLLRVRLVSLKKGYEYLGTGSESIQTQSHTSDHEAVHSNSECQMDRHLLLFDMHHIISDGVSMNILMDEFARLYAGEALAPLRIQYKDYAVWQQSESEGKRIKAQEAYWLDVFAGDLPTLELPTDYARPAVQSHEGAVLGFALNTEQSKGLKQVARQTGATLYMTLLAAYTAFLHKYSGQEDIIVGTPIAGRTHADIEPLIGMFVNTLAIRSYPAGEKTFERYVEEVKAQTLNAYAHQEYPFEALVEQLPIQRDLSRNPLFDTMFILQNMEMAERNIEGLQFKPYANAHRVAKFDLTLNATEQGNTIVCELEYATALYERSTIERMVKHFVQWVNAITAQPGAKLSALALITMEETKQIIEHFNATAVDYPANTMIHQLFEAQAERMPDRTALVFGAEQLSYREVNERANQLARTLRMKGIQADQRVGLLCERSLEMVIGVLAVLKAGGAYVPIDPSYPAERMQYMLEDAGVQVLLAQGKLLGKVQQHAQGQTEEQAEDHTQEQERAYEQEQPGAFFDGMTLMLDDAASYSADGSNLEPVSRPNNLAYVIYTSGTTGQPKGVMVEHHSVVNVLSDLERSYPLGETDAYVLKTAFTFDVSVTELFGWFVGQGKLVILPPGDERDPMSILRTIEEQHITHINFAPAMLGAVLQAVQAMEQRQEHQRHPLSSLRYIFAAGEALPAGLAVEYRKLDLQAKLENIYGPTESTIYATRYATEAISEAATAVPIGKPLGNIQAWILDGTRRIQPVGVRGELYISGSGLARGYMNRPELTAERFVEHPYYPGERMYRTGDLARWLPDGNIEYLGRGDDQVKIRGYRIELGEVEHALLQLDSVEESVVLARESRAGQKALCAYVVMKGSLRVNELRSKLARRLPGYMIPSYFVQLEALPLNSSGKIDRKALPAPEAGLQAGSKYEAPRTEVERILVSAWESVLGVSQVGIRDHFFELGGDSIKAIQVSSRLYQWGYQLDLKSVFKHPYIAELSHHVETIHRIADQQPVTGAVTLTPIQQWFFEQQTDVHHFNQSIMLYRESRYEVFALERVLQQLVTHHDALRMVFHPNDQGYTALNRNLDEGRLYDLEVIDFRSTMNYEKAVEAKANEIQSSIDLHSGPLMKLGLFQCTDGDHLLIVLHHLVVDGVSWRILLEDLMTGYEQVIQGNERVALPLKTDSFQTWADHLAAYALNGPIENERSYWESLIQIPTQALPKDHEANNGLVEDSERVTVVWSRGTTEALQTQAHKAYNTEMNDLLLTALGLAVYRWSGLDMIKINLEGHGREAILPDIDISRTVGWFTSQYPVVLSMTANESLSYCIRHVKEQLRNVPNKGIGYGIWKYLSQSDVPDMTAPEISFNYLGQFDQVLQAHDIKVSSLAAGIEISPKQQRRYSVDINGMIADGELMLGISYNGQAYRRETIERLAEALQTSLQEVVMHCLSQETSMLTPSDMTLKGMSIAELERLAEQTRHIGEIENVYPLTPLQKGMWFHNQLEPSSAAYFEHMSFTLQGAFDTERFKRSMEGFVQRQAVMRTNLYEGWGDQPIQVVYRHRSVDWTCKDLRGMGDQERQTYLERFAQEDKLRGFDLSEDSLMRIAVFRTGDASYHFQWSFHHILMDGWCLSLVIQEVFSSYMSIEAAATLEQQVDNTYSRYIEWLEQQDETEAADYWNRYLAGYEQQTVLPQVRVQGSASGYIREKVTCALEDRLLEGMNQIAKQHQVTLNTLMQTLWGVLLQTYNGTNDVVFGSVVSGRPSGIPGIETMIGLFINTIPVRIQCDKKASFADVAKQVQEQALASQAYETYPLYEIQAQSMLKQSLIDHIMVFENYPMAEQVEQTGQQMAADFEVKNVEIEEQTNYDFNVIVMPGKPMRLKFEYNALKYDRAHIERILGHLVHLIEQIVNGPDIKVHELNAVTAAEQTELIERFNATAAEYPRDKTIHQLFEERVERTPEQVAVVFGSEQLTYQGLNARANQLARSLRAKGVKANQLVGILCDRSLDMVVAMLGILKAGGAYVPIDPEYPADRIQYMLEDSRAEVLLIQRHLQANVSFAGMQVVLDSAEWAPEETSNLESVNTSNDLAYVMYTSGTTGKPKGNLTTHYNIVRLVLGTNYIDLTEQDNVLQASNYAFDGSTFDIYGALLNGARLTLISKESLLDMQQLTELIEQQSISVMFITTALFNLIVDVNIGCLARVRHVLFGGERVSVEHVRKGLAYLGEGKLKHVYGPTECTVFTTCYDIDQVEAEASTVPIGSPISNATVYIVNPEYQLQPIGVAGELCVGGDGLVQGYLNRPDLTAEKFVANPFVPGERMYRTGDLARWLPDGTIEYLGRIDDQVKIRGFRIELGEVESALLQLEAIQEAIVVARGDDSGQKALCAYFVADADLAVSGVKQDLARALPSYMIPSYFVQLDAMPLTPNGKVDRRALPEPEGRQAGTDYVAPRTPLEAELAAIWQDVLGVEQAGVQDNFFELGGHSLRATTLVSRIHKALDIVLPLAEVFQAPTIEAMAKVIEGMDKAAYVSIPQAEPREVYPVSSAQKRLYILQQMEEASTSYNMPGVFQLEGSIDLERFEAAFRTLVVRHETLRTGFEMAEGEPVQRIHEHVEFAIEYLELNEDEVDERIYEFVRAFVLDTPPLLRVRLVALKTGNGMDHTADRGTDSTVTSKAVQEQGYNVDHEAINRVGDSKRYLLLFDMHHIISDGVSMNILVDEFARLYAEDQLPPLTIQYKDYAVWQQSESESERIKAQEAYWLDVFTGDLPVLELPTDHARPAVQSHEGATLSFVMNEQQGEGLKQVARHTGATLYMTLLAAYTAFLHKYSGQEDIIVGTPIAGRTYTDIEPLIGMFVNTLAIRSYPTGEKTFEQYVQEVKLQTLNAYAHQAYPFEALVEQLPIQRDLSRNPLFDVMFVLQNMEMAERDIEGLQLKPYANEHRTAKFDLTLNVTELGSTLVCELEYAVALFERPTVERMVQHFIQWIDAVTAHPEKQLAELEVLSEAEKIQLTEHFNATVVDYPRDSTIHGLFEAQAERTPDQPALVYGDQQLTYREVNERANQLARTLRSKGVQADQPVAILAERSLNMIIGVLAILKAGGAYVPIDPNYPEERMEFMLEDAQARVLLLQSHMRGKVAFSGTQVLLDGSEWALEAHTNLETVNGPKDLAYVIYTSGTTGKPKGVMIEHQSVVRLVKGTTYVDFTEEQRLLQTGALVFDASTFEIWGSLLNGHELHIVDEEVILNAERLKETIDTQGITMMWLTSPLFNQLSNEDPHLFKGLKTLLIGGDVLSVPHIEAVRQQYPQLQIVNGYGPTENTTFSTTYTVKDGYGRSIPIGKPIDNSTAYIVHPQALDRLQPIGVIGELCVGGDGLARGYLNRPELTAEKFVDNSYRAGERMYRTGDLARWLPDGNIEYLGRIDDQVKIRGYRIELEEVEHALLQLEAVEEAVVLARKDGSGQSVLCAYMVMEDPMAVNELRSKLARRLPSYMIPSYFVQVEAMPLTPSGKIDRKALPAPEGKIQTGMEYTAPRTPTEIRLSAIWSGILEVDQVGIHDNFFDLGGHSLRATTLISRIYKVLHVELPLRDVFQYPTIEQMAAVIDKLDKGQFAAISKAAEQPYYPVSSAQKRMYLMHQIEGTSLSYNMPTVVTLEGTLDLERFESTFQQIIARHETLRTGFGMERGEPVQRIHSEAHFEVEFFEAVEEEVPAIVGQFVRKFELDQPPLLRVGLIKQSPECYILMLDMHHIISDGASMSILVEEFVKLYAGETLPPLAIQYKDYVAWQHSEAEKERIQRQEAYWLEVFEGEVPILKLPTKSGRPAVLSHEGAAIEFSMNEELSAGLHKMARNSGATLYMVLLAAFTILLSKHSGQEDIVIGSPIAGRRHADLEPLIGMFVNTLAIRNYPLGEKPFSHYLEEVKQRTLDAYEHQDVPFDTVVEKLDLKRDFSRNPLFDVMFTLQNAEETDLQQNALRIKPYAHDHTIAKFDLTLNVSVDRDQLYGSFEYSSKLFTEPMIQNLLSDFLDILNQIHSSPQIRLRDIDLGTAQSSEDDDFEFDDIF